MTRRSRPWLSCAHALRAMESAQVYPRLFCPRFSRWESTQILCFLPAPTNATGWPHRRLGLLRLCHARQANVCDPRFPPAPQNAIGSLEWTRRYLGLSRPHHVRLAAESFDTHAFLQHRWIQGSGPLRVLCQCCRIRVMLASDGHECVIHTFLLHRR